MPRVNKGEAHSTRTLSSTIHKSKFFLLPTQSPPHCHLPIFYQPPPTSNKHIVQVEAAGSCIWIVGVPVSRTNAVVCFPSSFPLTTWTPHPKRHAEVPRSLSLSLGTSSSFPSSFHSSSLHLVEAPPHDLRLLSPCVSKSIRVLC